MMKNRIFTYLLVITGIIGTIGSLLVDQQYKMPDSEGILLNLFFISPYIISLAAFNIRASFTHRSLVAEPVVLCLIIVMYALTHPDTHSYPGNSGTGYEWLPAFIAALVGIVLSLILILRSTFCYYKHKQAPDTALQPDAAPRR